MESGPDPSFHLLLACFYFSFLIVFVEDGTQPVWQGYLVAAAMLILTIVRGIINQQHFFGKFTCGIRIRSAINAAVYRKVILKCTTLQLICSCQFRQNKNKNNNCNPPGMVRSLPVISLKLF